MGADLRSAGEGFRGFESHLRHQDRPKARVVEIPGFCDGLRGLAGVAGGRCG